MVRFMFDKESLRALIDDQDLTPAKFAGTIGVSRQLVESWLKGSSFPSARHLSIIKTVYRTKVDKFFTRVGGSANED